MLLSRIRLFTYRLPALLATVWVASRLACAATATLDLPLCDAEGCAAAIQRMTYRAWPAYRLTDGSTEAVVVPALGRVMSFGPIGGPNLLWNLAGSKPAAGDWHNWGGDKMWPAPQSAWLEWCGRKWPPDAAWDGAPHTAQVVTGGHLITTSEVSPGTGARVVREYYFDKGEFVIAQTVEKLRGAPLTMAVWNITQAPLPDTIYVPVNEHSSYSAGMQAMLGADAASRTTTVQPGLARIDFRSEQPFKIGIDTLRAGLLAVRGDIGFLMKAGRPAGVYPDDAGHGGFPVEVFHSGKLKQPFAELEFLSPLRPFVAGARWKYTVRWSWHRLGAEDEGTMAARLLGVSGR